MESKINFDELKVNGIKINYFYICKRKLWLYDRRISMEQNSDKVLLGKILHENSYQDKNKEIKLDNLIAIDILDNNTIKEVKSSDKMKEADIAQIKYYLYYLETLGIKRKGIINYPKQRKRDFIELDQESRIEIENTLIEINKLLKQNNTPSVINKPYCKKCSYYDFCYS